MTAIDKAVALLNAFVGSPPTMGVTELAQRAGLPKSTAHRVLKGFVEAGYVSRMGDRYVLSDRLFELAHTTQHMRPHGLREYATPYLTELQADTGQTVHLAILVDDSVLYLDKVFGHGALRTPTAVGVRRPSTCTALGRAMLAYAPAGEVEGVLSRKHRQFTQFTNTNCDSLSATIKTVREKGVASECNEFSVGMQCIAAPVVDTRSQRAAAAVSVSFPSSSQAGHRFTKYVIRTADALSKRISKGLVLTM